MDIEPGEIPIRAVENTDAVHNVIVCTLCSCYPRYMLGLPPDWYKSRSYRSRTVHEPRRVLAERSEEHTSELQSLMRISYAVFCLKKKTKKTERHTYTRVKKRQSQAIAKRHSNR